MTLNISAWMLTCILTVMRLVWVDAESENDELMFDSTEDYLYQYGDISNLEDCDELKYDNGTRKPTKSHFQHIGWLPESADHMLHFVDALPYEEDESNWDETVLELHDYILHSGVLFQGTHEMISVNKQKHPSKPGFESMHEMCAKLNAIIKSTPQFKHNIINDDHPHFIGVPMAALFWHVGTNNAGMAVMLSEQFNRKLKNVINKWKLYLDSNESFTIEQENEGWLSKEAKEKYQFNEYLTSRNETPYWNSWNDFFTRRFKPDSRYHIGKDENNNVMELPNDGTSHRLAFNVKRIQKFWLKEMPYSLQGIFGYDYRDYVKHFEDGSIFQSYLNPFNYHNYHAPVSGVVKEVDILQGAYFPQLVWEYGVNDQGAGTKSLPWLATVNARGILIIDTYGYQDIGLVCMVAIGMGEVSSVNWYPKVGDTVVIGQRVGNFKFGGSSIAVINENAQKYGKKLTYNSSFTQDLNARVPHKLGALLASISESH